MIMLNHRETMKTIARENIKGGSGTISQQILIDREDMAGYARHCVVMHVNPGCSIGPHDHPDEAEFFYMLEGELMTRCDGQDVPFLPGDASFTTGAGNTHLLENRSDRPAKLLAIVMTPREAPNKG